MLPEFVQSGLPSGLPRCVVRESLGMQCFIAACIASAPSRAPGPERGTTQEKMGVEDARRRPAKPPELSRMPANFKRLPRAFYSGSPLSIPWGSVVHCSRPQAGQQKSPGFGAEAISFCTTRHRRPSGRGMLFYNGKLPCRRQRWPQGCPWSSVTVDVDQRCVAWPPQTAHRAQLLAGDFREFRRGGEYGKMR